MNPNPKLVLASSSTYRQLLLKRLRLPFEVITPDIDETPQSDEPPAELARRLAREKSLHVAKHQPDAWVIGADQVGVLIGEDKIHILPKPGDFASGLRQLQLMRGQTLHFFTAIALSNNAKGELHEALDITRITMRSDLNDEQLARYLELDRPYDCAGSAKAESLGIVLMESIDSQDPTALIGLPLIALTKLLRICGLDPLFSP